MKFTILGYLILSSAIALNAQQASDLATLSKAFAPAAETRLVQRFSESTQNRNELQLLLSGLFLTYKAFVSSQDQNRCSFTPSCSEYGLLAVKKMGIIRGGISTFDRLARCNGLNGRNYEIDFQKRQLIDQPSW
jgi:uncharacterized protein